jgi:hypothetical protein
MAKKVEAEKKFIFTSKNIDEITEKINDGVVVKRYQNPWFKNEIGVRRAGITFMMTEDEIQEYIKCKLDIHYFAEKYCKVKTEDGTVTNMTLRDYQKDILDLYTKNRFSILMASRQVGKCFSYNTEISIVLEDLEFEYRVGKIYYLLLSKERKLKFVERFKMFLYDIIYWIS